MQKRLRLKENSDIPEGFAYMNKNIFKILKLTDDMDLEVVVSKKKFRFKLKVDNNLEDGVFLSKQEMIVNGLSNNTIATVRGFKS
jgi:hypothetical protein